MSERKLSPGPWVVLEPYTDRAVFPIAYEKENAFFIFAEVNSQGGTPEQCRANADCMAAARDMRDLCVLALGTLNNAKLTKTDRLNATVKYLELAIAKAEGRARCPGCGCYEVLPHEPGRPLLCKDCEPSAPIADFTRPTI